MYKLLIGSHVSLKSPNYLVDSLKETLSYDANAMMIYTGAPQNTVRVPLDKFKIEEFKSLAWENNFDLNNVIIHAPYIFNPANSLHQDYAVNILVKEIERTAAIGAKILVLHPGSHLGEGYSQGISNSANVIKKALDLTNNLNVIIAIETMAGKGSEICYQFEQVRNILNLINSPRAKVCLDSCHIHDAGYNIKENFDDVFKQFDEIIGLSNIVVIHINDSKNQRGARKDRHENIDKGYIGANSLLKIIYHPKLENVPKILETPYIGNKSPYKEEILFIKENSKIYT